MNYTSYIENSKLIKDIESISTTGDADYDGTALEISEKNGDELFHVVVDKDGELQILFLSSEKNYRLPLELMERIILKSRQIVKRVE
jgi:hypothetical protein